MSDDKTDPGLLEKAKNWNAKADPSADRLMGRIQGSEYSAVIIVLVIVALIGLGAWVAW